MTWYYLFSVNIDRSFLLTAKIEQPNLPIPKVDTIVSEPIGVLLFHERMVSKIRIKLMFTSVMSMLTPR